MTCLRCYNTRTLLTVGGERVACPDCAPPRGSGDPCVLIDIRGGLRSISERLRREAPFGRCEGGEVPPC